MTGLVLKNVQTVEIQWMLRANNCACIITDFVTFFLFYWIYSFHLCFVPCRCQVQRSSCSSTRTSFALFSEVMPSIRSFSAISE